MTPKFDKSMADFLAYLQAGAAYERPWSKYEKCLDFQAQKIWKNYMYVNGKPPGPKAYIKLMDMTLAACKKFEKYGTEDMKAWIHKHKSKIKRDPASLNQAVNDIINDEQPKKKWWQWN